MSSSLYRRLQGIFTTAAATTTTSLPKTPRSTTTTTTAAISGPKTKTPKYTTAADTATTTTTTTSRTKPSQSDSALSSKLRKFKLIVKKFKKASESDRFRLRNYHYETTVRRLAAAKLYSDIEDILDHQKKYTDITNERFVVRLISLYGKSGMFDQAQKLFDEMPQLNCERTVMSFNALLAACVNCKKFDKIGEFLRDLPEKLSIEPDRVSYNTVIKAFCEMGSLDSALLVINEMEKNGLEPDSITFNTLLDAFYRNKRFSEADDLWALMETKNVVPNVRSYNPKLRGLVAVDRISEAVELIDEMKSKGLKPDVYSFNGLIRGFVESGNLEEAKKWYGEIAKSNSEPTRVTFVLLLPLVCDKLDFEFALELCKEAISSRVLVDTSKMQRVVDGLVKELMIDEAEELVKLGKSNNYYHYKLELPTKE